MFIDQLESGKASPRNYQIRTGLLVVALREGLTEASDPPLDKYVASVTEVLILIYKALQTGRRNLIEVISMEMVTHITQVISLFDSIVYLVPYKTIALSYVHKSHNTARYDKFHVTCLFRTFLTPDTLPSARPLCSLVI